MARPNRIELTINTEYLPSWGRYEGVRELIQNAKDAQSDGFPMEIGFNEEKGTLIIISKNATLSRESLLLGTSSKAGGGYIGQFGEGLKLGVLALVRAGCPVTIYTGSGQRMVAKLAKSKKFSSNVLCFDVTEESLNIKGICSERDVVVQVDYLPEWPAFRKRFLFIQAPERGRVVDTLHGQILLDEPGAIYSNGIWVCHQPKLKYGYNTALKVDRDRKMADYNEIVWQTTGMWTDVARDENTENLERFFELVEGDADDVRDIAYLASGTVAARAAERFTRLYGETAYPCASEAEATDLEHLGVRGIVVNKVSYDVLKHHFGNKEELAKKLHAEVTRTIPRDDLDLGEMLSLDWALTTLFKATGANAANVQIAEFRSKTMQGQFKDGGIYIARHMLADKYDTLGVLIHEACHCLGADGEKRHVWAMEKTWQQVCKLLNGEGIQHAK